MFYNLYIAVLFVTNSHRRAVEKYLAEKTGATLRTPVDLLRNRPDGLQILVSTLPELDFPLEIPSHIIPCGPIVRMAPPLLDVDPELDDWLCKGSTVYINLGSMFQATEGQALEMAVALRALLDTPTGFPDKYQLQILWKLKRCGEYKVLEPESKIYKVLGKEIEADRVRIVDWVSADPIAILQTGHIACSVHHGGANSFNEAVV